MEPVINRLKQLLEEKGLNRAVTEFWMMKQDVAALCNLEPQLRGMPLIILLYSSEFLCHQCYSDAEDPPQRELLEKTCSFIKQLHAANWSLSLTKSGNPCAMDVLFPDIQEHVVASRESALEVAEMHSREETSPRLDGALDGAHSMDGSESVTSKPDSVENIYSLSSNGL